MNTFVVDGKLGKFEVNLPESLEEISKEYLAKCTDFVHPAPNYVLVAIVYKDHLALVLNAAKKKQSPNINIVPVFVKAGNTDSEFIKNLTIGDKIVVAGSDLSIGHHINSPYNKITPSNIVNICEGDKETYAKALVMQNPVCFIEFKLVPANAIHGHLEDVKNSYDNDFIKKVSELN